MFTIRDNTTKICHHTTNNDKSLYTLLEMFVRGLRQQSGKCRDIAVSAVTIISTALIISRACYVQQLATRSSRMLRESNTRNV